MQYRKQSIRLLWPAHRDADTVLQAGFVVVAHKDATLLQRLFQAFCITRHHVTENKVGVRWIGAQIRHVLQGGKQAISFGLEDFDHGHYLINVAQASEAGHAGGDIHIIGLLKLPQLLHQPSRADAITQAQTGNAGSLAKSAQNDQIKRLQK